MDLNRRHLLQQGSALLLLGISPLARANGEHQIVAVRIWPAQAYTRTTIESTHALRHKHFLLDNPRRLVIDLQGASLNQTIQSLPQKLIATDPYIAGIRVGQFTADTVRIVMDLKTDVNPQVFTLTPVANFKHRLVIDLYPTRSAALAQEQNDPLMALLQDYNRGHIYQDGTAASQAQSHLPPIPNEPSSNQRQRRPVIMLDPGHGGEDPGATGPTGVREKNVVLAIARETRRELERYGYQVFMTRNEDVFIPLRVRVARARAQKADLFISIHADSFTTPNPRGAGVYVLDTNGASNETARQLAQSQNAADRIGGINSYSSNSQLNSTIFDLVQTATINDSLKLGRLVLNEMGRINRLHQNKVQRAPFLVLRAPDIPSILVETAFISNPTEEKMLTTASFRQKVAQAIAAGTRQYLATAILSRR